MRFHLHCITHIQPISASVQSCCSDYSLLSCNRKRACSKCLLIYISLSRSLSFQRYVCESWYIWSLYAGSAGPLLSVGLIVSYLIKEAKSRPSQSWIKNVKGEMRIGEEKSASVGFKLPLPSYALLKIKIHFWHQWFNKEHLPSMEPLHSTKGSLQWKRFLLNIKTYSH